MDSRLYAELGAAVERAKRNGGSLTEQNLLYVAKIALDVEKKTGVSFDELFPEGVEEMVKREKKYDPSKNNSFTGYCGSSIRQVMLNYVNRDNPLVHIPANHQKGFKKGQEAREDVLNLSFEKIDGNNYDTLGMCDSDAFNLDRAIILRNGLDTLEETAREIMKMRLKLDEYSDCDRAMSFSAIAEKLELTVPVARKIYNEAFAKLSAYCQREVAE